MTYSEQKKNGLNRFLIDDDLEKNKYSLYISERAPGESAHKPHSHAGIEIFYVMRGEATVKAGKEEITLYEDESIIIDANKLHTITNSGLEPNRYAVVKVNS